MTPDWLLEAVEHATLAGIAATSEDGVQSYVNPAFCRMLGWSREELLGGRAPFVYWPPEETPALSSAFERMRADQSPREGFELRLMRRDGSRFFVQMLVAPLRNDAGQPCGHLASIHDITDRKRHEQEHLDDALHRLGMSLVQELDEMHLIQRITDEAARFAEAEFGAFVINDGDGRGAGPVLCAVSGLKALALVGVPESALRPLFEPTLAGGGSVRCDDVRTQGPREGTAAPQPHGQLPFTSYLAVPVESRSCEVLGGLLVAHSQPGRFTERQERLVTALASNAAVALDNLRLVRKIRRSEQRAHDARRMVEAQRNVLELIAHGARLPDILDSITRSIEALGDKGLRASILLLDRTTGILRHGAGPSLPAAYNEAIDGMAIGPSVGSCGTAAFHDREIVVTDIAIDPLWLAFRELALSHGLRACWSTPIHSSRGEVLGTFAIYYDEPREPTDEERLLVTALTRTATIAIERAFLDESLAEASRRKDEFLALLGHELRNPLAPIVTALDLLSLGRGDGVHERRVIERQVRHMVQLVDDLLDISRITRGKVELKPQHLDLAATIRKAVEMASPLLEQRAHKLTLDLPREHIIVDGDPVRLAQVFANLLTNAAKFTKRAGQVSVAARRAGDRVVVDVRDDGIGIRAEFLARIFEPFFQGERLVDGAQGGLGLGLPLVWNLVRLHGGSVSATSEGPGHGSCFSVTLPLARVEHGNREPPVAAKDRTRVQRKRVLVVDDNEDAAHLLAEALRVHGHDVLVAHDGPSALAIAANTKLDVAIVDIGLPVMDGYEVGRQLAEQRRLLLVALTGYGQETDMRRSAEAGFKRHLVKPADMSLVLATIAQAPS
jgi:PAS domain S-box-containing protein